VPWTSPNGTPLEIAAAHPRWFWSDLLDALVPNGRLLDFDPATGGLAADPLGVKLETYVDGLFATGYLGGYYLPPQPPGSPNAAWDLNTMFTVISAGEPYGAEAAAVAQELRSFHQGFGIPGGSPAPLLLESGWNDDLFPPSQSLRVYNDLRARDPNADVSLLFGDVGHARGSNKLTVNAGFNDLTEAFFAKHLLGSAASSVRGKRFAAPDPGSVTTYEMTCPANGPGAAPDAGPHSADSWNKAHPGAVFFAGTDAQTVVGSGGNPATAAAFDPIGQRPSDGCATVPAEIAPGTAVYTYDVPATGAFTLLGLPTIEAEIATSGPNGQLAARLWDVSPGGEQLLVTRGNYRLLDNQSGSVTFQLHGNGYRFGPGHTAKLELLGADSPYLRSSNGAFSVTVSKLTVELPTLEAPGAGPGIVPPDRPRRCGGALATLVAGDAAGPLRGTPGPDVILGSPGSDSVRAGGGRDRVCGRQGADELRGGRGGDMLRPGAGPDRARGGRGRDVVRGASGDDRLGGGPGNDRLHGGPGDDHLRGGPGSDRLFGGSGLDEKVQ